MNIILNNTPEEIINKTSLTVKELLVYKNFTFPMLVIKINETLVKKDDYNNATIKDGDIVNVIHLISGG